MASCMAAAAHRRAIEGERQYLTLRQTLARAHDILDDVGAGEGAGISQGRPAWYGEHLVDPFQDRSRNAVPVWFETAGEIANEGFGPFGVVHFPGLPQDAPHRSVHRFGQPFQNVARLVNLATLDRRSRPKVRRIALDSAFEPR